MRHKIAEELCESAIPPGGAVSGAGPDTQGSATVLRFF